MSTRSRTLDQVGRVADELAVDALFIVHRHPWHWPAVVTGFAFALVGSRAFGAPWVLAVPIACIGGGFGMNVGCDFRFIARTPTRLLLMSSSRVIARPTGIIKQLAPHQVAVRGRGLARTLVLDGEAHVLAGQQVHRLERMRQ
ncbi:MAG: hypothetical protein Q8M22_03685 [Actinomycetota bacterium]|nr:hypothetical protein [Actinomycetota bacterium]